jgi:hypothetical protein
MVLAVWMMASGCMVIDDPRHCANREGDATCEQLYGVGVHCDACDHFHHGCVDERPAPECRVEDDGGESESTGDEAPPTDEAAAECDDCAQHEGVEGSVG